MLNGSVICSRRCKSVAETAWALSLFALLWLASVGEAANLRQLHKGSATITGGMTIVSANLTPQLVDSTKAFLTFTYSARSTVASNYMVRGHLVNRNSVSFYVDSSVNVSIDIQWQVYEFESGVSVQRGCHSFSTAIADIAINSVTLGQAFPLTSNSTLSLDLAGDNMVSARLTSSTNLRLEKLAGASTQACWQVIDYAGALVQEVNGQLIDGQNATTQAITAVDPTKTLIFSRIRGRTSNLLPANTPRIELTDGSTLTYARHGVADTVDILTHVVELTDSTKVLHGTRSFTASDTGLSLSIAPLDTARSAVLGTGHQGSMGSSDWATNDSSAFHFFRYWFQSPDTVRIYRGYAGSVGEAPYQIVSFSKPKYWDGGGGTNYWSDALNWNNDLLPGPSDSVVFDGYSNKTCILDMYVVVGAITFKGTHTGSFDFSGNTLEVRRDADLRSGGPILRSGSFGELRLAGTSFQRIFPHASDSLPTLRIQSQGNVAVESSGLLVGRHLLVSSGTLSLGTGLTHVVLDTLSGSGTLAFGTSSIQSYGTVITQNLTLADPADGHIHFMSPSPQTQNFIPSSDTQPNLVHEGTGKLSLGANTTCVSFLSNGLGTIDLGAANLTTENDLILSNGGDSTLLNLGGKTLTVGGNARFHGASSQRLHLTSPSVWYLSVTGSVTADRVVLKNSSSGLASAWSAVDSGGNTNWNIYRQKLWNGAGADNNWSTPENWTGGQIPGSVDSVVFDGTASKDLILDTSASIVHLYIGSGYSGTFDFGVKTLSVIGNAHFDPAANIFHAGGSLRFHGAENKKLSTGSLVSLPRIVQDAIATVTVVGGLNAAGLVINASFFDLGSGMVHKVDSLYSSGGFLDFKNSHLEVAGNAMLYGYTYQGTGMLKMTGNALQKLYSADTLPRVKVGSTSTVQLAGNVVTSDSLLIASGTLALNGNRLHAKSLHTSGGSISVGSDTLFVHGEANFSGLSSLDPGTGAVVIKAKSTGPTLFQHGNHVFGRLVLWAEPSGGSAAIEVAAGNLVTMDRLILRWTPGTTLDTAAFWFNTYHPNVSADSGIRIDTVGAGTGPMALYLGDGTYVLNGSVQLTAHDLQPGGANLVFEGTGIQDLYAGNQTFDTLYHSGTGTLRLNAPLSCNTFIQKSGSLDFNGWDLSATNDFFLAGGGSGSLIGLAGRTITAGFAYFGGVHADHLNLSSGAWTLTAAGAQADYADIGSTTCTNNNCMAYTSADLGSNSGWTVTNAKVWSGQGATQNWSDSANWTGHTPPLPHEPLVFNNYSTKSVLLDINDSIHSLVLEANYSGVFDFGSATLKVADSVDFRGGTGIVPGSGRIEMTGVSMQNFHARSGATHPKLEQVGSSMVYLLGDSAGFEGIRLGSGSFDLGGMENVWTHGISGTGSLNFAACTLIITGDTADFQGLSSISGTGNLIMAGSMTQYLKPAAAFTFGSLFKGSPSTTVILGDSLKVTQLTLDDGTLDLGDGLTHVVGSMAANASAPTLDFGSSSLIFTGVNANFTGFGSLIPGTGKLILDYPSSTQILQPKIGALFPDVIQRGTSNLELMGPLTCKTLEIQNGSLLLGTGHQHQVSSVTGMSNTNLDFGSSTLMVNQGNADLYSVTLKTGSGLLKFTGGSDIQVLTALDTLPEIEHPGAGTLRIGNANMLMLGYHQSGGILDMNGFNLSIVNGGSFDINQGGEAFAGLEGRRLDVDGSMNLTGTTDNPLMMNWATPCSLYVGGSLMATHAHLGKVVAAASPGSANLSINSGNNTGWTFIAGTVALRTAPLDVSLPSLSVLPSVDSLPMLQFVLSADTVEGFVLDSLRTREFFAPNGTIALATLWRDLGSVGTLDDGDVPLASATQSADSTFVFQLAGDTIEAGGQKTYLLTYRLNATVLPADSFQAGLDRQRIALHGHNSGLLPIWDTAAADTVLGPVHNAALQGTIALEAGSANSVLTGSVASSEEGVAMLHFRLTADDAEALKLDSIAIREIHGKQSALNGADLIWDRSGVAGSWDGTDTLLASTTLGTDSIWHFSINGHTLNAGEARNYLLAYRFASISLADSFAAQLDAGGIHASGHFPGSVPRTGNASVTGQLRNGLDTQPPFNVTALAATATTVASVALSWNPSSSPDVDSVFVLYLANGTYPSNPANGTLVGVYGPGSTSATATGLNSGSLHHFAAFTRDSAGNWSSASTGAQDTALTPSAFSELAPALSLSDRNGATNDPLLPALLNITGMDSMKVAFASDTGTSVWKGFSPTDTLDLAALPEGPVKVFARFKNKLGQLTPWTADSCVWDKTLPVLSTLLDTVYLHKNWPDAISGNLADAGSGPDSVMLLLMRNSDGRYFDGSKFIQGPAFLYAVVSGTSWNYALPKAHLSHGSYTLTHQGSDKAGNSTPGTTLGFRIQGNRAPAFLGPDSTAELIAGKAWNHYHKFTDPDGDALTFSLLATQHGNIDSKSGWHSWNPGEHELGAYTLKYVVTDGVLSDTLVVQAKVVSSNKAPVPVSHTIVDTVAQNTNIVWHTFIRDTDVGDTIMLDGYYLPAWASLVQKDSLLNPGMVKVLRITGRPIQEHVGSDSISCFGRDRAGARFQFSKHFFVKDVNDPPAFTARPDSLPIKEKAAFTLALQVKDPDPADILVVRALQLPSWLSLSNATLSGTPGNDDVGSNPVVLTVSDGRLTDTLRTRVLVENVNDAPQIQATTLSPGVQWLEDRVDSFTVNITDPDRQDQVRLDTILGARFVRLKKSAPTPGSGSRFGFAFEVRPGQKDTGAVAASLVFKDAAGAQVVLPLNARVLEVNDTPYVSLTGFQLAGGAFRADFSVQDEDGTLGETSFLWKLVDAGGAIRDSGTATAPRVERFPLVDGDYTFSVRARDRHGLAEPLGLKRSFVVTGVTKIALDSGKWVMATSLADGIEVASLGENLSVAHWNDKANPDKLSNRYLMDQQIDTLRRGKGYWLYLPAAKSVSVPSDRLLRKAHPMQLTRGDLGWNQVGNPFAYPVDARATGLKFWEWNAAGRDMTLSNGILKPWGAYWVQVTKDTSIQLSPKPYFAAGALGKVTAPLSKGFHSKGRWVARLHLQAGDMQDGSNYFGISGANTLAQAKATSSSLGSVAAGAGGDIEGLSGNQRLAEPPRMGSHVNLFFLDPGSSGRSQRFAGDIREAEGAEQWWDLGVAMQGAGASEASLSVDGWAPLAAEGMHLFLVDKGQVTPITEEAAVKLSTGEGERYYSLVATSDAEFSQRLTLRAELLPNAPNPVASFTVLRFRIPQAWAADGRRDGSPRPVRITLHDARGRVVKELLDSRLLPGEHSVHWVRANESRRLAPGQYFYRLEMPGHSLTRKMVLR